MEEPLSGLEQHIAMNSKHNTGNFDEDDSSASDDESRVSSVVPVKEIYSNTVQVNRDIKEFFTKVRYVSRASEERNRKLLLAKGFFKWAKVFPLHERCDELARVVSERSLALESIRESYLRDIVAVKHYLQQVAKESGNNDMYDLHTLPSASMKKFIDCVRNGTTPASNLMQETLLNARLINPSTGGTFKPWEESKTFRRILKSKKGHNYEIPAMEGQVIPLGYPSTHKIVLKCCKSCLGVVNFTRAWNEEVEESLRLNHQAKNFDNYVMELKQTIASLNNIIAKQEAKLVTLEHRNFELEKSSDWLGKWKFIDEVEQREMELTNAMKIQRNIAAMNREDSLSQMQRIIEVMQVRIDEALQSELQAKMDLDKQFILTYKMQSEKTNLRKEIDDIEAVSRGKDQTIAGLERQIVDMQESVNQMKNKVIYLTDNEKKLLDALDIKEREFQDINSISRQSILNLTQQVAAITNDYNKKEDEVDYLRDELRELRATTKPIVPVEATACQVTGSEIDASMYLSKTKASKYSLRTMVWVVRLILRIQKCIAMEDFRPLGPAVGTKYHAQLLQHKLLQQERKLGIIIGEHEQVVDSHSVALLGWKQIESDLLESIGGLKSSILQLNKDLQTLQNELQLKDLVIADHLRRDRVLQINAQLQRNLVHETLAGIFSLRCRIFLLKPEELSLHTVEDELINGNTSDTDDEDTIGTDEEDGALLLTSPSERQATPLVPLPSQTLDMLAKFRVAYQSMKDYMKTMKRFRKLASFAIKLEPVEKITARTVEGVVSHLSKHAIRDKEAIRFMFDRDRTRVHELRRYLIADFLRLEELVSKLRNGYDEQANTIRVQKQFIKRLQTKLDRLHRTAKIAEFKTASFNNRKNQVSPGNDGMLRSRNHRRRPAGLTIEGNNENNEHNDHNEYLSCHSGTSSVGDNLSHRSDVIPIDSAHEAAVAAVTVTAASGEAEQRIGIEGDGLGQLIDASVVAVQPSSSTIIQRRRKKINREKHRQSNQSTGIAINADAHSGHGSIGFTSDQLTRRRGTTLAERKVGSASSSINSLKSPRPELGELGDDVDLHEVYDDDSDDEEGDEDGGSNIIYQLNDLTDKLNEALAEIISLRANEDKLLDTVEDLYLKLASAKDRETRVLESLSEVKDDLEHWQGECNRLEIQNNVLRGSVEGSYRKLATEKQEFITRQMELTVLGNIEKSKNMKSRGTNITCSVCDIRAYHNNTIGGHGDDFNDDTDSHMSSHTPVAHEGLALAMDGAYVLLAKPRNINSYSQRHKKYHRGHKQLSSAFQKPSSNNISSYPPSAPHAAAELAAEDDFPIDDGPPNHEVQGDYPLQNGGGFDLDTDGDGDNDGDIRTMTTSGMMNGHVKSIEFNSKSVASNYSYVRNDSKDNLTSSRMYYDNYSSGLYNEGSVIPFEEVRRHRQPREQMTEAGAQPMPGSYYDKRVLQSIESNPSLKSVIRPKSALASDDLNPHNHQPTSTTSSGAAVPRTHSASKFRMLKNMPVSNGVVLGGVAVASSMSAATARTVQGRRTVTNTAAYLQRKIVEDALVNPHVK